MEECEYFRGLPVPPMFKLLIELQFSSAGKFRCTASGDLVNMFQPTVSLATVAAHRQHAVFLKFPEDWDLVTPKWQPKEQLLEDYVTSLGSKLQHNAR
ncbi:hypothetical protein HPB47_004164 [Ixodes persulcatus]|uniref:Uncharacterized protein n=1 Tax=Ixodes persulcatus TaxID=34615 RepID=A0AC60PHK5_IXOPE|nr:hypothetical protein HPB47_004164 [Ixodes persulcatus]